MNDLHEKAVITPNKNTNLLEFCDTNLHCVSSCVFRTIDMLDWDSLIDSRADTSHLLVVPDVEVRTGVEAGKQKWKL